MLVLNDKGVPCLRVGEYVDVGKKKVQVGTTRKKWGRGYREEPVFAEEPIKKKHMRLIPAIERGWKKEIVFEKPVKHGLTGRIEIHQYRLTSDNFRCSRCGTSRHILLYLMGWSYDKYPTLPHKGSGVMWRCFKCDLTVGAVDESKYGESKVLTKDATEEEAVRILKKYGLDAPEFGPIG